MLQLANKGINVAVCQTNALLELYSWLYENHSFCASKHVVFNHHSI